MPIPSLELLPNESSQEARLRRRQVLLLVLRIRVHVKGALQANRNEEIHAVPVKTIEHQAIASLHRLRSTWLATRTARLNTLRGQLREFGIFIPVGRSVCSLACGRS